MDSVNATGKPDPLFRCNCCYHPIVMTDEQRNKEIDRIWHSPYPLTSLSLTCDLCQGTMTSVLNRDENLKNSDVLVILKAICHVGNAIIAAVSMDREAAQ